MKVLSSRRIRRFLGVVGPIVLAALIAAAFAVVEERTGTVSGRTDTAGSAPGSAAEVTGMLAQLKVAPEASMNGYSREKFPHWDSNKAEHGFGAEFNRYSRCTTREVMMLRDAEGAVQLDPATCQLTVGSGGGWRDEYGTLDRKTGQLKPYKWITDPAAVDAEHIVALAEAWRSGAAGMDEQTRRRIANDALNLQASDPTANRSKGDQDAANYLPPGKFRCAYVDRYLRVKVKYGLTVDSAEQAALRTAVDDCVRQGGFR
ncbi:HNH endonuclease family protein [Nocardia farcinica]|uniref:HNH endonuclease family protein n=1 Tax=Nocardia farcinica TaxID=37329 RepID=UPI0024573EF5|nr:HNH endonuclease family protein [Nocardia farcinica]